MFTKYSFQSLPSNQSYQLQFKALHIRFIIIGNNFNKVKLFSEFTVTLSGRACLYTCVSMCVRACVLMFKWLSARVDVHYSSTMRTLARGATHWRPTWSAAFKPRNGSMQPFAPCLSPTPLPNLTYLTPINGTKYSINIH